MQTNYADTILNITLTGAMVRIDLGTVVPVTNPDGAQETRVTQTQQLVMPLDGFVQAFGVQEQVIRKLLADGVLKANAEEGQAQPQVAALNGSQVPTSAAGTADSPADHLKVKGRLSVPGKRKLT